MKKKKMSIGAALILAVLFLLFGTGGGEEAKQTAAIAETVVQEMTVESLESDVQGDELVEDELQADSEPAPEPEPETEESEQLLDENEYYYTKEEVALYIHQYGCLPSNYISKKEAQDLGWEGGSVEQYAPGKCIGGSRFGNYEGLLPEKEGRFYTECDIDTLGKQSRGAKRIVFSNDGLIYYTDDHYESFELLYGEE